MTPSTTPLQVLPQFVEVLGKKLDKISAEMDRFLNMHLLWMLAYWYEIFLSNIYLWSRIPKCHVQDRLGTINSKNATQPLNWISATVGQSYIYRLHDNNINLEIIKIYAILVNMY